MDFHDKYQEKKTFEIDSVHRPELNNESKCKNIPDHLWRTKYTGPVEWRRGCSILINELTIEKNIVTTATICHSSIEYYGITIRHNGDMQTACQKYLDKRRELYLAMREGEPIACEGCPMLVEGFYPPNLPKIKLINFGTTLSGGDVCKFNCLYCPEGKRTTFADCPKLINFGATINEGDVCQFNCLYCCVEKDMSPPVIKFINIFREIVGIFSDTNYKDVEVWLGVDEITISSWRSEVLSLLKNRKWYSCIFTNGTVFNQEMAEMIRSGYTTLIVNLDAGTRETFIEVKGVDCFENVVDNLRRYAMYGTRVVLKYIFVDCVNTNKTDIDGFLKIAQEFGFRVHICRDYFERNQPITEEMREMISYFIRNACAMNIEFDYPHILFFAHDFEEIKSIINNARMTVSD